MCGFPEVETWRRCVVLSLATLFSGALTVLMLRFAFATTTSPASLVPHCRHVFIDLDATSPAALHRLINPTAFPGSPVQATFDECFGRSQEERSRVCMYSLSPSLELAASMEHYRTLGFAIKATHDLADFSKHTRVAGRHIVVQLGRDKSTISAALGLGLLCSADTVISQADESAGAADTLSAELAAAGCSTRVLRIQDDSYREFRLGQALPLSVNPSPPMDTDGRPLRIGLCATLSQSEDPYLMEWVTYYFGLGVEAMLLVDNADEGLPPLAERVPELGRCFGGSIVVVRDVRRFQQFKSYDRCAAAFSAMQDSGSWWVLACDADEYLVLRPNVTIPGFVADVVTRYNEWKKVGAVVANWYIMGSDDHNVTERDAPVTFRFQARQPNANKHVKSIARASSVTGYGSAHNPGLEEGYSSLDSAGRIVKIHLNEQPDAESVAEAWVAHYYTKSLKEYRKKWLRNSPDTFRQAPSEEGLASMIADCRPPHVVPESRVWEAFVRVTGGGTSVSLAQLHACARSRPVEAASLQYVSATELGLLEQCRNAFHIAGAGDSPVCEAL